MAQGPALICKLLATSVSVANRAGKIIRDVMDNGNLGIISKVNIYYFFLLTKILRLVIFFLNLGRK